MRCRNKSFGQVSFSRCHVRDDAGATAGSLGLSLEELTLVETTTSARTPTELYKVPAAFLIPQQDIRRSGVTSIPEALRLAPASKSYELTPTNGGRSARIRESPTAVDARDDRRAGSVHSAVCSAYWNAFRRPLVVSGAITFLTKPLDVPELLGVLEGALAGSR